MGLLGTIRDYFYTRNRDGSHWYMRRQNAEYFDRDWHEVVLGNHIAYQCISFISELCSQAEYKVVNKDGDEIEGHWLTSLIANPNPNNSKEDFLRISEFQKLTWGYVYELPKVGLALPKKYTRAIYTLNPRYIRFPKDYYNDMPFPGDEVEEVKFTYSRPSTGERVMSYKEVIPLFDTPPGATDDRYYRSVSRLQPLRKPISNVDRGLDAENIILGTNGREMFYTEQTGNVAMKNLDADDKRNIETKLATRYDMSIGGNRSIALNQKVGWQSLHIKLQELGLNESYEKNGTAIRNAFGISEELYSLINKGATYENQSQAMLNFVQNVAQNRVDDRATSYTQHFLDAEKGNRLVASFAHLPCMQVIEDRKADKVLKLSQAYRNLSQGGFTDQEIQNMLADYGLEIIRQ